MEKPMTSGSPGAPLSGVSVQAPSAPAPVVAMPPAAATLPPPTPTLPARSTDDLAAYSGAFDDSVHPDVADDIDDDVRDTDEPESEPAEAAPPARSSSLGFPAASDVPEPRTADDDEPERPSPIVRPDRSGRLSARLSARR